ncbi:hypothetical protein BB560_002122 [Smittium megazygosporum]|uniref:Uncharacterized protein n=1 Tax=Smittium megazygosporum TaxID=133381 RepID=A0A2T9ZFM6_9FUNG|nr:hypothetical protein BB560_002122 [Smittium megazygosporum]
MEADTEGIDFLELKEDLKQDFLKIVDSVRGVKILVVDECLLGVIDQLSDFATLQEHGVQKLYKLEKENNYSNSETQNVLYIIRPLLSHVRENIENGKSLSYNVKLVPRRTILFEKALEDMGVLGELVIDDFPLLFVPIESDLLVLNSENSFKEMYIDGDYSSIFYSSQGLMDIQSKFGLFPRILGKGDCAQILSENLIRMRKEISAVDSSSSLWTGWVLSTVFDSLIIIDRGVDLITPLLTQLTYHGLLDEYFNITNESIEIAVESESKTTNNFAGSSSENNINPTTSETSRALSKKKKRLKLDDRDAIFAQIKGKSFMHVGKLLSQISKDLQVQYESRHNAKSVNEVKKFVKGLGKLQTEQSLLQSHISATSSLIKFTQSEEFGKNLDIEQNLMSVGDITKSQLLYLEQIISLGNLWYEDSSIVEMGKYRIDNGLAVILRLVCLYFLVKGDNIKKKNYENIYNLLISSFGFQHIITFQRLYSLGMFGSFKQDSSLFGSSYFFKKSSATSKRRASDLVLKEGSETQSEGNGDLLLPSTKPRNPSHSDTFGFIRRDLNLNPKTDNYEAESSAKTVVNGEISDIYGGYVPISLRLVQCLSGDNFMFDNRGRNTGSRTLTGWKGWEDAAQNIAGQNVDVKQSVLYGAFGSSNIPDSSTTAFKQQATLVMFLGGITYSEIAALRLLSRTHNHKYIIATTDIINGTSFINQMTAVDK